MMSSVIFNIKEETLSKCCLHNALTYIVITPPRWLKPAVDNGQQTTDNSLRFWRLSLKKSYSKFNLLKSYLTKLYKVWFHALRYLLSYTIQKLKSTLFQIKKYTFEQKKRD